ncbi:carboxypeptidase N subunit 2 [Coregonus clupeaformis]|uniref:carboxypeptidase N subunit 2 n=1 Tax=Coregonus clupeaformis TaxID=59861 RepID=UPI001E1C2D2F|nr:carboxypeptidase N subunit 2 [Coregonus clupeaformis]
MWKDFGPMLCLMLHLCYQGNTSDINCPPRCQCFTPTQVMCSEESMRSPPMNISTQVKELVILTTGMMHLGPITMLYSHHLTKLVFFNNLLRDVSTMAFDRLTGLEELEISGNSWLDCLNPGTFSKQRNLTKLLLNFNRFKSLSDGLFSSLQKLRTLQLKGNIISHLPRQLFQNLLSIRALDLSLNMLTGVDEELLSGMSQLESLKLGYNMINVLFPDTFLNISHVKELCLQGNQISYLPQGVFSHLEKLEELNLRSNLITNVSSGTFPSGLKKLDLKGNRLVQLSPDSFGHLTGLTQLFLSMNQLTNLPEDVFRNLTDLQNLDLSENQLTSLPGTIFQGLTKIEIVHLQNNNLSSLKANLFEDQAFLEQLYLSENKLQTLPQGFFDAFFSENVMRLRRNPWSCDCHMLYLYDYVAEHSHLVEDLSNVYCKGPEPLRGQGLVSLERDQLVCPGNLSSRAKAPPFQGLEERPHPSNCTVQVINDDLTIKCKVTKCSPLRLMVQFQEGDGSTSEYIMKKDWAESSQCSNGTITLTV